jgi:type II secretory pathway predicted ATPase ExeA
VSAAERDPFAQTDDIAGYVARPATDAAFAALEREVFEEGGVAVLTGPPGIGKTLLLRRLAARARGEVTPIYLPYAALLPAEFCSWSLAALDAEPTDDPMGFFRVFIRHLQGSESAILLVVDDAASLPQATARWLAHLAAGSKRAVRVALAAVDGAATSRMMSALGEAAVEVRLDEPMSEAETREYLAARLGRETLTADDRSLFEDDTIAQLQRVSAGIPQRLHAAAAALLRGERLEQIGGFQDGVVAEGEGAPVISEGVEGEDALAGSTGEGRESDGEMIEPAHYEPRSVTTPSRFESLDSAADSDPSADSTEFESDVAENRTDADTEAGPLPPEPDTYLLRPAPRRVEPAPALRWVLLAALLVAGAAVTIPLMRVEVGPEASAPAPRPAPRPAPSRIATPPMEELPVLEPPAPLPTRVHSAPSAPVAFAPTPVASPDGDLATPGKAASDDGIESVAAVVQPAPAEPEPELEPAAGARRAPTTRAVIESAGPFDVSINATPWANIEIDGVDVGVTPIGAVPLLAGPHTFKARMPDGRVIERDVEISAEDRFVAFE